MDRLTLVSMGLQAVLIAMAAWVSVRAVKRRHGWWIVGFVLLGSLSIGVTQLISQRNDRAQEKRDKDVTAARKSAEDASGAAQTVLVQMAEARGRLEQMEKSFASVVTAIAKNTQAAADVKKSVEALPPPVTFAAPISGDASAVRVGFVVADAPEFGTPEFPYGKKVTVLSNATVSPVHMDFYVDQDGVRAWFTGPSFNHSWLTRGQLVSVSFTTPPVTRDGPLVFQLIGPKPFGIGQICLNNVYCLKE